MFNTAMKQALSIRDKKNPKSTISLMGLKTRGHEDRNKASSIKTK